MIELLAARAPEQAPVIAHVTLRDKIETGLSD